MSSGQSLNMLIFISVLTKVVELQHSVFCKTESSQKSFVLSFTILGSTVSNESANGRHEI